MRIICDWQRVCTCLFSSHILLAHLWRHYSQALLPLIAPRKHWFIQLKSNLPYDFHMCFLSLYHRITTLSDLEKEAFWKHCGKRRKCWSPAFSPFPTMFSTLPKSNFNFWVTFILSSANAFNLDQSKNLSFGKELKTIYVYNFNSNTTSERLNHSSYTVWIGALTISQTSLGFTCLL